VQPYNEVNGIWFYRQEECDEMSALFNKITSAFAKQPIHPVGGCTAVESS
jgi:hypothetical protein